MDTPVIESADIESNLDSTRRLASIQEVAYLEKHANADSLSVAFVLGWRVVVKTGEVSVGDKVIFCEIDSLIPSSAAWLPQAVKDRIVREKSADKPFRVKTIQLRQALSQGLIIPISSSLPRFRDNDAPRAYQDLGVGTDLTAHLGVLKYEAPAFASSDQSHVYQSKATRAFPSDVISKTDEMRVQSSPEVVLRLVGKPYCMSVKMDGTSVTYLVHPTKDEFVVASRNMIRDRPESEGERLKCPYWHIAEKRDIERRLREHFPHLAIQGEICGPNIQKNLSRLDSYELFVFNVFDLAKRERLALSEMQRVCEALQLRTVPIDQARDLFDAEMADVDFLLAQARGYYEGTSHHREGLVIRSQDQSVSFKVINNDYLLAQK